MTLVVITKQNRIPGCGTKSAIQIARTGIGRELIQAVRTLSIQDASAFAHQWVQHFRDELRNKDKILPQRYARLAEWLPLDFPDINVINLYVHPLTSTAGPAFEWTSPDLCKLVRYAEENFLWGHFPGILRHFSDGVFPGFALRELMGATLQNENQPCGFAPRFSLVSSTRPIISECRNHSTCGMSELRIAIPIPSHVISIIRQSLKGKYRNIGHDTKGNEWIATKAQKVRAWVPFATMQMVYPKLVAIFTEAGAHSKGKRTKPSTSSKGELKMSVCYVSTGLSVT